MSAAVPARVPTPPLPPPPSKRRLRSRHASAPLRPDRAPPSDARSPSLVFPRRSTTSSNASFTRKKARSFSLSRPASASPASSAAASAASAAAAAAGLTLHFRVPEDGVAGAVYAGEGVVGRVRFGAGGGVAFAGEVLHVRRTEGGWEVGRAGAVAGEVVGVRGRRRCSVRYGGRRFVVDGEEGGRWRKGRRVVVYEGRGVEDEWGRVEIGKGVVGLSGGEGGLLGCLLVWCCVTLGRDDRGEGEGSVGEWSFASEEGEDGAWWG